MTNKEIVIASLNLLSDKKKMNEAEISKYFSQNYLQIVDGKSLDYDYKAFVQHLAALAEHTEAIDIEIEAIVGERE
ncbi:hypothetical protein [Suttonella ornithocola]|nr:hypothetical protein [Suttonella ornithocola]